MSFWPSFAAWPFAVAGLGCATLPLVIHLLNRRRYRTVPWAAMDFLREAMQQNRKILRLRDVLLLLLRTAAILLVGCALARPYFAAAGGAQSYDGRQPLHAVLLIDNSQSMGYASLEGDLLSAAKRRAAEFIERLPGGSKISVIPVCGGLGDVAAAPFESKSHALEALESIVVVGRQASISTALNQARFACEAAPELAPRIVLLTDNQRTNWTGAESAAWRESAPIQLVSLAPPRRDNTWISSLRLQDQLADTETPATVIVQIRHVGDSPREDLQVTLRVDDVAVASQTVSLDAGDATREVYFEHLFDAVLPEQGKPWQVVLEASIPADRLPHDDRRFAVAQVVAALPVVFVDEFGAAGENLAEGRVGATRPLRKLLAPSVSRDAATLVAVRHVSLAELTRDQLADARLCVMAGVAAPGADKAELLRQYVRQGGQLLLAAGDGFDPASWTAQAWQDGAGVLPAPLTGFLGATPSEAGPAVSPFNLDFDSLRTHQYFQLAGVSANELRDLYAEPLFFKAVVADTAPPTAGAAPQPADSAATSDSAAENETPRWVVWPPRRESVEDDAPAARVLARFDRQRLPFLLERPLGEGRVILATSDVLGEWNTMPHTNAVLIYDRVLRDLLESTLPERNFEPQERLDVPLVDEQRGATVELIRPDAPVELLTAGFIGGRRLGVVIQRPLLSGLYRLNGAAAGGESRWTTPFAVAARSEESDLRAADPSVLAALPPGVVAALGADEPIRLAGAQIRGQILWWWLVLAVLLLLLLELLILAWGQRTAEPPRRLSSAPNSVAPNSGAPTPTPAAATPAAATPAAATPAGATGAEGST